MTGIKLVAMDLDGTLIGSSLAISAVDRAAVERVRAAGIDICIATGRLFSAGKPFADELGLEGFLIPLNGAAVFDVPTRRMVHAEPLDAPVALEALDWLRAAGFRVQLYFGDHLYLDGRDARTEHYLQMSRVEPVMVPDLRALLVDRAPAEPGPMKVLGIGSESNVLEGVRLLGAQLGPRANVFRSQPPYLEVTDPHADKGSALRWVASRSGAALDAVAAIGDSDNDVPMFAAAGRSFAVANGTPAALAAAKTRVGPQGRGVAEALELVLSAAHVT